MRATNDHSRQMTPPSTGGLPVLVVDDSAVNRELALSLLKRLACPATVAVNGREALAVLAREHHAAVLMDLWMPELDGLECTRAIRQAEVGTGRHTPIIAVTSLAGDDDLRACMEAGMDDHLVKPLTLPALERVLRRWAPNRSPLAATVAAGREAESDSAAAVVDMAALARLRQDLGGDWGAVVALVETYLAELSARVEALHAGLDQHDVSAIRLAAHTLGTTSSLVGATALAAICRELETKAGADIDKPAALAAVEAAAGQVRSALRRLER